MKKVFTIMALFGLLWAALTAMTACGPAKEVRLGADDDGRQVELEAGQTLAIGLESNPTTGYTWEVAELDEHILRQVGETEFEPESGAIGAGGVETLRFETVSAGQTALRLVYHRPWEKDVEPLATFSVQVVVR